MQVSILIPTYKRPDQLREALASLEQQDTSLIGEIIVGDDSPIQVRPANVAEVQASRLAHKIRYIANVPRRGSYPNQCFLGDLAQSKFVLVLHDDDHLCPHGLDALAEACAAESDSRVQIWFGRNQVMDERGRIDPVRTAESTHQHGKDGPDATHPCWQWCLMHAIPPDAALMRRDTYVALMRGPRDGNAGDWGMAIRLANSGAWGHFVDADISRYRMQMASVSHSGRGIDMHFMYEMAHELNVPAEAESGKDILLRDFAEVATLRYLRDGERNQAWKCFASNHWGWKRRLSPRGFAMLAMLLTPAPAWRWALQHRD